MATKFQMDVAAEMIRQIEAGTAPWQKPWEAGVVRTAPFNAATGQSYRGVNNWWLELQGHQDPRWMTYHQAQSLGAQVRKGEKGTHVEYWKWREQRSVLDDTGKPKLDDNGQEQREWVRLQKPKMFQAVVFNAGQIDGLAPFIAPAPNWQEVGVAEQLLQGSGIAIHHDQQDRAFYRPGTDKIHLPPQAAFKDPYEYYATALHELGHATGHPKRLDRPGGPFGSETYAREELRAEMASYMMSTELGLGHYPERHAGYVESWLKAIKEDPMALHRAARDAEVIRTWVMEPDKRQALEKHAMEQKQAKQTQVQGHSLQQEQGQEQAPAPAPTFHPASLPGVSLAVNNGFLEATGRDNQVEVFGGTPALVHWAMDQGMTPQDLGTALELQAQTTQPDPAKGAALAGAMAPGAPVVEHPQAGAFVGPVIHLDDHMALQRAGQAVVIHDLAAVRRDGAALAALALSAETGEPVTVALDQGKATVAAPALPMVQEWAERTKTKTEAQEATQAPARTVLEVPFKEKDLAKAAGARWDKDAKVWYAPQGADLDKLAQWQPKEGAEKAAAPMQAPATEQAPDKANRTYLAVPYEEKGQAKAAGAKWDRHAKSWYAPDGADLDKLAKWHPKPEEQAKAAPQTLSPQEQFAEACRANGLKVEGVPLMDGSWHRVSLADDKKGVQNGSYRGFLDGHPNGQIMNFKLSDKPVQWVADGPKMDPAEQARQQAQAAQRQAERANEARVKANSVANQAGTRLRNAQEIETIADHPYLDRKQIDPLGLPSSLYKEGDHLLIPMGNKVGMVRNIQSIAPDGQKRYMAGGEKQGLMYWIEDKSSVPIAAVVCEGFATGASLHEATGLPVVVAFDAANLRPVAEAVRQKHPHMPIILAADDDHGVAQKQGRNPGLEKATEAARAVGGVVIKPPLTEAEKARGLTDFNDIAVARGKAGLEAIETAVEDGRQILKQQHQAQAQPEKAPTRTPGQNQGRHQGADMAMGL